MLRAQEHKEMRMKDWVEELDKFVENYGNGKLIGAGKVSRQAAMRKAEEEYRKYQVRTLSEVEKAYIDTLTKVQKKLEKEE